MLARNYLKDVRLTLDLAQTQGDLKPMAKKERELGLKMLCPGCPTPNLVNQFYGCSEGHGPFAAKDCTKRGKIINKEIVLVDTSEIPVEESTLEISLNVHPREEVESGTWPTGAAYDFRPEHPEADQFFNILCDLVCEPDLAFVGTLNMRGIEKLFRLVRSATGLVLNEICFPSAMYQFEPITPEYQVRYLEMALNLATSKLSPFDPSQYINKRAEFARKLEFSPTVSLLHNLVEPIPDIEAMLNESIARRASV